MGKANPVCPEMTFPLNVEASDTGSSVKTKINEVMGVAPSEQTLILSGKIVADDRALSSYNIQQESTLHVMVPVKVVHGPVWREIMQSSRAGAPAGASESVSLWISSVALVKSDFILEA